MKKERITEFWRRDWAEFKRTAFDLRGVAVFPLCIVVLVLVFRTCRGLHSAEQIEQKLDSLNATNR